MGVDVELMIAGKVALASVLGYLVGFERSYRRKDAGARTFALLALGSAAFVAVALELFPESADRVIQGVAAGVGFLGGGIIFRAGHGTRGLTTAAASWAAAAVGVLAGAGTAVAAVLVTILTIAILVSDRVPFLRSLDSGGDGADDQDA